MNQHLPQENRGLTDTEKAILNHLVAAWNLFVGLESKNDHSSVEFMTAIHDAQKIIALRVASRVNPEFWSPV